MILQVTKAVGSQQIPVATLSESNRSIQLSGLEPGYHEYTGKVCWSSGRSGGCNEPFPMGITVDPNASFSELTTLNASAGLFEGEYEFSWPKSFYDSYQGYKSTVLEFKRKGVSENYQFYSKGRECNPATSAKLTDLVPGDYEASLKICGERELDNTTKTCNATKTVSFTVQGESPPSFSEPEPVPAHGNIIDLNHGNTDSSKALVGTTHGNFSVSSGSAFYTVPIVLPPLAGSLMPGLSISYGKLPQNRETPLVNVGFDWAVRGFTDIPDCDFGTFEDCVRNRKDRQLFIRHHRTFSKWFQPFDVNIIESPNGMVYRYGDNSSRQGGLSFQLTEISDLFGNSATLHYRPDHQLGFIYFSSREAVVFNYNESGTLSSITTIIDADIDRISSGVWVNRYEISHTRSMTSDHQMVSEIRQCGFDSVKNKECAKPLTFDYTQGQLGYDTTPIALAEIDENIEAGFPGQNKIKTIRSKRGKFKLEDMAISTTSGELVINLFDHVAFKNAGAETVDDFCVTGSSVVCGQRKVMPVVDYLVGDFNGDGLDDIHYGGAYWYQRDSQSLSFEWSGIEPQYDITVEQLMNGFGQFKIVVPNRDPGKNIDEIIKLDGKPVDINGDGHIDRSEDSLSFPIKMDVVDYNKDGRSDSVYIKDGQFVVDFNVREGDGYKLEGNPRRIFGGNIGDSWAAESGAYMDIYSGRVPGLFLGDATGDGVADAWVVKPQPSSIYAGLRGQPDLLSTITDGFGAQIKIEYDTLHSDDVEGRSFYIQAEDNLPWPNEPASRSMNVVKTLQRSNGQGGFSTERFYYEKGWYNYHKRKFVGFEKISHVHVDAGITSDTYYNLEMPIHGTVKKVETKTNDGDWISRVTNLFEEHDETPNFVYNRESIVETFKLQSSPISVTKTTSDYDAYGSLTWSETVTGTGLSGTSVTGVEHKVTASHTPAHDLDNWLLGFVTDTTITTEHGDGSDRRTVRHEYEREPGTLQVKESVEYVGTPNELTTTYIRDQRGGANRGLVTETIVRARDDFANPSQERTVSLDNFEEGMYPTESYNSLGHLTVTGYDKRFAKVNYSRDANGLESFTEYDALGRSIKQTAPDGAITRMQSYFCNNSPYSCPQGAVYVSLAKTTHPLEGSRTAAPTTVTFYDSLQRVIRTQTQGFSNTWVKQDTEYDELGRLYRVSEPYTSFPEHYTVYEDYDALGRPLLVTSPDGGTVASTYVKTGSFYIEFKQSNIVGSMSNNTDQGVAYFKNSLGQIWLVNGDNGSVRHEYDSQGNLESTVTASDESTRVNIEHDLAGNKLWIDDPAAGRIDYFYNGFGELREQYWEKDTSAEKSMTFKYDELGRLEQRKEYAADGAVSTSSWLYDQTHYGLLFAAISDIGYTVYFYDDLSRPDWQQESFGAGAYNTYFDFDNFSRPLTTKFNDGTYIKQFYSTRGVHYKTQDITNGRNKTLWQLQSTIDARGNYRYSTLGNGVGIRHTYDPVTGALTNIAAGTAGSSVASMRATLQNYTYQWDSIGNLQSRHSGRLNSSGSAIENITERFEYDRANRLQYAETFGSSIVPKVRDYEYDVHGNLIHNGRSSQQFNEVNGASVYGVTRANNKDYHYDAYGNVTRRGTTNIEYDVFNKTTRIGDTQFWYDADRKKVKQQTGDKVTYFYAGGAYEVEKKSSSEKRTIRVGNYVKKVVGSSVTEEYHLTDHLGSTDVITNAAGTMVQRMAFDAFGNRLESHFAANDSNAAGSSNYKGYTGHDMVDNHELIHMGGRVYDPDAGRFLSADIFVHSASDAQSFNRYSYVRNNPLTRTDPSGYSESQFMSMLALRGEHNSATPVQTYAYEAYQAALRARNQARQRGDFVFQDSSGGSWQVTEGHNIVKGVLSGRLGVTPAGQLYTVMMTAPGMLGIAGSVPMMLPLMAYDSSGEQKNGRFSFEVNNKGDAFPAKMKERFMQVANSIEGGLLWGSNETVKVFYNPSFKALEIANAHAIAYRSPAGNINIVLGKMSSGSGLFRSIVAEEIYHAADYSRGLLYPGMNQATAWQGEVRAISYVLHHRSLINFGSVRMGQLQSNLSNYQACLGGGSTPICN